MSADSARSGPSKPIVNIHTHIFTDRNIPRLLARKMLPWPFHWFLHLSLILALFKAYKRVQDWLDAFNGFRTRVISFLKSTVPFNLLDYVFSALITFNAVVYLLKFSKPGDGSWLGKLLNGIESSVLNHLLVLKYGSGVVLALFFLLYFLYPSLFRMIYALGRLVIDQLKSLPTKRAIDFAQRYLLILEFTKYAGQKKIFDRLVKLYEPGSKMVVLPMDMEYMGAGRTSQSYLDQIREIEEIIVKKQVNSEYLIPFLFVDPRRIRDKPKNGLKPFFDWEIEKGLKDGKPYNYVRLKDCTFRDCFEGPSGSGRLAGNFKGVKLYPALGYFPFDEDLLPVWAYCVQHDIPITTHCIIGTIFYRGRMKKEHQVHPVFKDNKWVPLSLKKRSNYDLQENFTHPLNYLCLLDPYFLAELLKKYQNQDLNTLFGWNGNVLSQDLRLLKVNLAHYGGSVEWIRYMEMDRGDLPAELEEEPDYGIELSSKQRTKEGENPYSKPHWIWSRDRADWFSIISSLMLQYDNVYADISYILHTDKVKPMLQHFLRSNEKLSRKILFGTDFFVVRNHKSERELLHDLESVIGREQLDMIARENPEVFLRLREGEERSSCLEVLRYKRCAEMDTTFSLTEPNSQKHFECNRRTRRLFFNRQRTRHFGNRASIITFMCA